VRCGDVGSGEVVKLCNNMVLAVSMLGVAEAMNLGTSFGMDPKLLASILNSSTARCWSSDTYNPCPNALDNMNLPANRNYTGGFGSSLMLKDLKLAMDAAHAVGSSTPIGRFATDYYADVCEKDGGKHAGRDFGVV